MWQKYVSIAILNYNTPYHASIGCEPRRVFHGRNPYFVLGFKMGIRLQQAALPTSHIAQDVLEQIEMVYQDVRKNAVRAYIKYIIYYDNNANGSKFKLAH